MPFVFTLRRRGGRPPARYNRRSDAGTIQRELSRAAGPPRNIGHWSRSG
jgi:hypothetical protein